MVDAGDRAVRFIQNLTLVGDYSGQPLVLRPWQANIVRKIFGTLRPDGLRQYRKAFIFLPRGNAKTTLLAAIGLYCLIGEGKSGQQIVSAACDHKQAALIFDTARQMVEADDELKQLVEIVPSQKRLVYTPLNNAYFALSSDAHTKHGLNVSVLLFDELHAQPNRELWDVLTTSQGKRREPLVVAITTAGVYNPEHVAWQEWDYARRVDAGLIHNPAYLPILYGAEPDGTEREIGASFERQERASRALLICFARTSKAVLFSVLFDRDGLS